MKKTTPKGGKSALKKKKTQIVINPKTPDHNNTEVRSIVAPVDVKTNVSESTPINERTLTLVQRIVRGNIARKNQAKLQTARRITGARPAQNYLLRNRAERYARRLIKQRYAGKQGFNYQSLSPTAKMQIDGMVSNKMGLGMVKLYADRLYPQVKQAEMIRLQLAKNGKVVHVTPFNMKNFMSSKSKQVSVKEEHEILSPEAINSLFKKSEKYQVPVDVLVETFDAGVLEWLEGNRKEDTAEKAGFNKINAKLANLNSEEVMEINEGKYKVSKFTVGVHKFEVHHNPPIKGGEGKYHIIRNNMNDGSMETKLFDKTAAQKYLRSFKVDKKLDEAKKPKGLTAQQHRLRMLARIKTALGPNSTNVMADNLVHNVLRQINKPKKVVSEGKVPEPTMKTTEHAFGKMKVIHRGAHYTIPLHPEHHNAIARLKDGETLHFRDETRRHWSAKREGDNIHFNDKEQSKKTTVPMHWLKEDINETVRAADYKMVKVKLPDGRLVWRKTRRVALP